MNEKTQQKYTAETVRSIFGEASMLEGCEVNIDDLTKALNGTNDTVEHQGSYTDIAAQILRLSPLISLCKEFSGGAFQYKDNICNVEGIREEAQRLNTNISEQEAKAILLVLESCEHK